VNIDVFAVVSQEEEKEAQKGERRGRCVMNEAAADYFQLWTVATVTNCQLL